jgi:hypothetical protein
VITPDPATLRDVAGTLDNRAEFYRGQCPCALHRALMNYSIQLAGELRTRAIRTEHALAEQRRQAALTAELPIVGGA